MKKAIVTVITLLSIIMLAACGKKENVAETAESTVEVPQNLLSGKYEAVIEVEKYGMIKLELDADTAPITVTKEMELAGPNSILKVNLKAMELKTIFLM